MSKKNVFQADMAKTHPLSILLVDDNAINLKVASRMLERMGYIVDQATNGLEALHALEGKSYDLILMDIQMPEMDGVTATKHIIANYDQSERPRIVAVTAHAMKGDRERYLEAGMDGYISKPVRVEKLVEAIYETKPNSLLNGASNSTSVSGVIGDSMPIDIELFSEMLGLETEDAQEMLPELLELFLEDSVEQIESLKQAVSSQDSSMLRNAAHKMKGGAASVAAMPLSDACGVMEKYGLDGELSDAATQYERIIVEWDRLKSWHSDN